MLKTKWYQSRTIEASSINRNVSFCPTLLYLQVEPSFKMLDQFIVENVQWAFSVDELETSRPMNVTVTTTDEIEELFDSITYEKGIKTQDFGTLDFLPKDMHLVVYVEIGKSSRKSRQQSDKCPPLN